MPFGARGRRGSALLIVLSILALVVLISTTMTYVARLETRSSANYLQATTARVAVLSGLDISSPLLSGFTAVTAPTQSWGLAAEGSAVGFLRADDPNLPLLQARTSTQAKGGDFTLRLNGRDLPAEFQVTRVADAAGRINLNAPALVVGGAGSSLESAQLASMMGSLEGLNLTRFLEALFEERQLSTAPAAALAKAIIERRHGADGQPGRAGADDNANGREARPESDGLDNDGDGIVDNPEERLMAASLLDETLPWLRSSIRDLGDDAPRGYFTVEGRVQRARQILAKLPAGASFAADLDAILAYDDAREFQPDLRRRPAGDDLPLRSLNYLSAVAGITEDHLKALREETTLFSASRDTVILDEAEVRRLNLHEATAEEILARLRDFYVGAVDDIALAQFAANVADWRDPDAAPTRLAIHDGGEVWGVERTAFITEVYPDARTSPEDGDAGQFVELYNPWNTPLELQGYRLRVGSNTIALNGKMAPRGYLVVTDVYEDTRLDGVQDTAGRYGSFLAIFSVVPNDGARRLVENKLLGLPDRTGIVELVGPGGDILDSFTYNGDQGDGTSLSFQRHHPSVRTSVLTPATPFAQHPGADASAVEQFYKLETPSGMPLLRDLPLGRITDLMFVPVAYGLPASPATVRSFTVSVGQRDDELDSRLLDLFTLAQPIPANAELEGLDAARAQDVLNTLRGRGLRHGAINLNTASYAVLMSLPGMQPEMARTIVEKRDEVQAAAQEEGSTLAPEILFQVPSDLLRLDAVWAGSEVTKRVERYGRMVEHLTTSSIAFEVTSLFGRRQPTDQALGQQAAARALVVLDPPETPSVLQFEYLR